MPTMIDEIDDWAIHANCIGKKRLFFAPTGERPQARDRREAKASGLCFSCLVRAQCRNFAREHHEYGFWGGENEEARHLAGFGVVAPIGIHARNYRRPKLPIQSPS